MKNNQKEKGHWWTSTIWINIIFAVFLGFLIFMAFRTFIADSPFKMDVSIAIGFILFLYVAYKYLGLRGWVLPVIFVLISMNIIGFFGAYNLMLFGIGYDKYLHFMIGFIMTISFFQILRKKENYAVLFSPIVMAFLMMMGIMAIGEIIEFVGSLYFGINQGFLAMEGSNVINAASDLVRYDSLWDLIFDVFGGFLAMISASLFGKRM